MRKGDPMSNISCTSQVLFVKENIKLASNGSEKLSNKVSGMKIVSNRSCFKTISERLDMQNDMILRHL